MGIKLLMHWNKFTICRPSQLSLGVEIILLLQQKGITITSATLSDCPTRSGREVNHKGLHPTQWSSARGSVNQRGILHILRFDHMEIKPFSYYNKKVKFVILAILHD